LTFEAESLLTRIKERCFFESSLQSICIPRSVETIRELCFFESSLGVWTFEADSRTEKFTYGCFECCLFSSVYVPSIEAFRGFCFAFCVKFKILHFDA
jgi:hypothetical protein